MRRFPWILTLCAAPALALLVGLGVWQTQRLTWKEGLIAAARAAADRPVAPLADVLASGEPVEFRRVGVTCPGLARAPVVELRAIEDGEPGVRLISACRAEGGGGRVWLVDRGFVAETVSARPPADGADTAPVTLEAVLRRAPDAHGAFTPPPEGRTFYARDAAAMGRALGVDGPVEDDLLFAVTETTPGWATLRPSAPPAAFSNNHLGYAATWFGLAIVLAGFYIGLIKRRLSS